MQFCKPVGNTEACTVGFIYVTSPVLLSKCLFGLFSCTLTHFYTWMALSQHMFGNYYYVQYCVQYKLQLYLGPKPEHH